jgi:UDP-N-acetylglucosamine--N-acetylmuramyl-(pentapeptide) pyrophosphoryl-undecaprenol N-acetylglucosamine transferase
MAGVRVLFAGGGTGGHLFPAIAIAEEIKRLRPEADIQFVGTKEKIEARVVPQKGYVFHPIWISGFRRSLRLSNLLVPLKIIVSLMQAWSIIRKFKPDVVVGTGGYVSGPVLRAAVASGVRTLIQEQNSYPGVTTRMLSPKVDEVHVTFERSIEYLSRKDNAHVTGNPTRNNLENVDRKKALEYFGFDVADNRITLLILGGSLGAHSINQAVTQSMGAFVRHQLRIVWQTGSQDVQNAHSAVKETTGKTIWIGSFIDRMDYAYAVADLVVCRAGATSLAEITRLGKPAILVPYPHAAADHQTENARSLVSAGAARIVPDNEVSGGLERAVVSLLDQEKRLHMSAASKKFGKPGAASDIAQRVLTLAGIK